MKKLGRLALCTPALLLGGCLTVPQISDELAATGLPVSYRLPGGCKPARVAMAEKVVKSREALGGNLRTLADGARVETQKFAAQTLLAMGGDERYEIGRLLAAGLNDSGPRNVQVSRDKLRRELQNALDAAQDGAFSGVASTLNADLAQGARIKLFEAYFEAYFRKGQVLQLSVDKAATLARLKKEAQNSLGLKDPLTSDQQKAVDAAAQKLLDLVCRNSDCTFLTVDDKGAFVNRAGQKFAFPTVTLTVAPGTDKNLDVTKIDEVQLVGDLTRIFWEAAYDLALEEKGYAMPFDPKATACGLDHTPFDCTPATAPGRQDLLTKVNDAADKTEGVAGAVAAQWVRGAWFASLDNEAIAKLLQTTVSINARKVAEVYAAGGCGTKGTGGARVEVKLVP